MLETTLNDAMFVPNLRAACCHAFDDELTGDGFGLRQCRLINRGLSVIMLSHVSNFYLRLDSDNAPIHDAAKLLRLTRISNLRVHVELSSGAERADGYVPLVNDALTDLDRFMSEAFPAFSNVQCLHYSSCTRDSSSVSSPRQGLDWLAHHNEHLLGNLCTSMSELVTLVVDGPVSLETWRNIGVTCPGLNCLDLEPSAHHHPALQQVTGLLPCVTSLKFHQETGWYDGEPVYCLELVAALAVLDQSDIITHLDLGSHSGDMDNRVWARLPPNLQSLVTGRTDPADIDEQIGMYAWQPHIMYGCLRHVMWNCSLEDATYLFRVAPNLTSFVGGMQFLCSPDPSGFMKWDAYLDTIKAMPELKVTGTLLLHDDNMFYISDFLAKASPSMRTTHVNITTDRVMSCEAIACIPVLFPHLDSFTINGEFCTDRELPELRMCHHLRHITFLSNDVISNAGVMLAACMFPVLESIDVLYCDNLDEHFIHCMIGKYGLSVKLKSYGYFV